MHNTLTKKRLFSLFGGLSVVCAGLALSTPARAADKPDFAKDVAPILSKSCVSCHGGVDPKTSKPKIKGKLDLTTKEGAHKGGDVGKDIVPGKAEDSLLYKVLLGPVGKGDDEIKRMPAGKNATPLSDAQIKTIKAWIDGGAEWPDGVKLDAK